MSASEPEFIAAQTTVDRPALAEQLASAAVGSRLAACVQITEATSVYRWEDGIEKDAEQLLTFKTTAQALPGLQRLLEREHPSDEPEFIVLPIVDGSPSYLGWVRDSVRPPADDS